MVISMLLFPFLALVGLILVLGRARGKSKEFQEVPGSTADVVDEVADYLKNPDKYRIPKGCLLVGPPGIRKNLLAGEADTSFSDELFVGSPSKLRDLFEKAKSKSPFIVFINEIGAGNNEQLFQSQTLISKQWEWDANGIPNSTHKYCEDQKVRWRDTPFEEKLDKALSEEFQRHSLLANN